MLGFIAKKLLHRQHVRFNNFKAFLSTTAVKSYNPNDDAVTRISKNRRIKSLEKPSEALIFLRNYGFTDAQISSIVTVAPKVLHSDPVKTLKPKFDHLISLGASNEALLKIIQNCPKIINMDLEKSLVPALDLLKGVVFRDEELITLITRYRILKYNLLITLGPNVAFLRDIGMSQSHISKIIMLNANAFRYESVKFKAMVERALAMGFKVDATNFGDAVHSFLALTEDKWEQKVEIFRKWGWSESEFNLAFRKQPMIMQQSGEKIEENMDYFVNIMGLDAAFLAKNPYALMLSLKKRIIPRYSVVQVLLSKGLIDKDYSLNSLLIRPDEYFLKAFVKKHVGVCSELLALYHSLKQ